MINKKEVVPPKHKPPTDGPENKNRLKRKLQTVEAELAFAKSGKTERQFRFIGSPFRFSGTLDYN